jgi:hypothetical protein
VSTRVRVADTLLLLSVLTITFTRVRWQVAGQNLLLSDLTVGLFVAAAAFVRLERRDWRAPRVAAVLALFLALFLLVYLAGFYSLETSADRDQFVKGLAKFVLHFVFLVAAVSHLAKRSERFYWRTLGWFAAGIAANGAYGLVELAYAETTGGQLDELVVAPLTGEERGGLSVFGVVGGALVYRPDALTLDPNHLGIMLLVPLLVLLPVYLRLERGHRLRAPLALLLGFLLVAELATISRSGLLGLGVGLLVLALPYRHLFLRPRFLVPLGAVVLVLAVIVGRRLDFFEGVLRARTSLGGRGTQTHLDFYELLPPAFDAHPLFGRGLNTFSVYFEFLTGRDNWGPHSYYVALLIETGVVGALVFLVFLAYVFHRLGALRALGRFLAESGDAAAARVRPLGWGFTAALVGTLAANAFYLTMQMYYFFVLMLLAVTAPVVFARRVPRG